MTLFRIVYVSEAAGPVASGLMPLVDIIGVSDRNNRRDHLTGVLMRHDGRFLQVLEGARADLDRTLGRVTTDSRHANLTIVLDTPIAQRMFPAWAMARMEATPEVERFLAQNPDGPDVAAQMDGLLASLIQTKVGAQ